MLLIIIDKTHFTKDNEVEKVSYTAMGRHIDKPLIVSKG